MLKKLNAENIVFVILVCVAMLSRYVAHSWNFTAVAACSFVFAMLFPQSKAKALVLPVLAMLISDYVIGFHMTMGFVYAGFAAALIPLFLLEKNKNQRLAKVISVVSGSAIFFVISNFGVWLMGNIYPLTVSGLVDCYIKGLPFYRTQLLADVVLTPAILAVTYWGLQQTSSYHNIQTKI